MPSPYLCERFHPTRGCSRRKYLFLKRLRPDSNARLKATYRHSHLLSRLNKRRHRGRLDFFFYYFRYADLLLRIKELESWTSDFSLPSSVWLSGFFNPQSFLTAIMQSTARKNELPLDKMSLTCEVSKKYPGESMQVPRDGAYVHGLFIEGARWVLFFLNITFV